MRIFLDANILISVLNKEYPVYSHSSRILSLADYKGYYVYTSPLCLAIAFYFASKKNKKTARQKITMLCKHLKIAPVSADATLQAANNPSVHDFEDGLEYYAAKESKCNVIITEDIDDFYFSDIEVLSSAKFFEKYLGN